MTTNNRNDFETERKWFTLAFLILFSAMVLSALVSCSTTKTIETTVNDSVASAHIERSYGMHIENKETESLYEHFLTIILNADGDTIGTKEVVKDHRYTNVASIKDSTTQIADSVAQTHNATTTKVIEKQLSLFERLAIKTYPYLITVALFGVVGFIIMLSIWCKKNS